MVIRTPEDIRLYARLGFLIYIDGYTAKIAGMKPTKDQEENDAWEFKLDPSDELIKRYNIRPNKNGEMLYTAVLPYDLVIPLNLDPAWTRYLYLRTYDGKETAASSILKGTSQQLLIQELKKQLRIERNKVEAAREKVHMMETNLPKYMKRNIRPFLEEFAPLIEKMMHKEGGK